jgi:hypothetical protein
MSDEKNYLKHLFYVPLVHIQVNDWEVKKKILHDLYDKILVEYNDNVWTNYHNDKEFLNKEISELLRDELINFGNLLNFQELKIEASWFEASKQNNYHNPHNHGLTGYSAVCYVDYDKNYHEATNFIAPFANFVTGDLLRDKPEIDEGSLILFPSSLIHYTNPNISKKERLILSFNLTILK